MADSTLDGSLRAMTALHRSGDRLVRLLELASKGRYLAVAPLLKRDPTVFADVVEAAGKVASIDPDQLVKLVQERIDESKLRFQLDFETALAQRGWKADGQWPTYVLGGTIPVRVDLRTQRITIGTRSLPTLDIDSAIGAIARVLVLLLDRPFEARSFLEAIFSAYGDAVRVLNLEPGQFAPINEIHKRVSQAKEYSAEAFGIDLSKLIRDPPDSRRIELSPARGPRGAIFVPLPIGGGFVSGIKPGSSVHVTANG
jgi:hypothetical protein